MEAGLGDLSRASDDFLHTSSHGILHLSVVHSRYTWWGITFKVKELSAIWALFRIPIVDRILFRLSLCFLFIYTPFVHTNASGVDSQGVQFYQLQWLTCMPKFNLYANTGEPISKVVCLSTLQLLCCCDIYQCLKRLNFMRKVQNFEMRMSLKISESTIVL